VIRNIAIITDINRSSGLGNFYRSKELFIFLNKKVKTKFFLIKDFKKNFYLYDYLILDLPNKKYNLKFLDKYKKYGSRICSLDHNQRYLVDVNISLYKKSLFAKNNLVDLKYCIIRKEFHSKKITSDKNLMFISIGSSDLNNISKYIKNKFLKFFNKIYLSSKVKKNNNLKNSKINQKKFINNMKNCALAVSNGGTTLLELLYFKKIVIVYPQNLHEKNFFSFLKKKRFKIFINIKNINTSIVKKLLSLKQKQTIIDEYGTLRIFKALYKYDRHNSMKT